MNIIRKKTLYARFKLKQRNLFGLVLIDNGEFSTFCHSIRRVAIGGKISSYMDCKVGTAYGQSKGLQVLGIGVSWPIYLEGIEECYILEPLVIRGLSQSVN